jgi:hypothetical protein
MEGYDLGLGVQAFTKLLFVPGDDGIIDLQVARNQGRRRLLEGIFRVSDGDEVGHAGSCSKEQAHARRLDAGSIRLGKCTQPRGRVLGAVSTGTCFVGTAGLHKVAPLNAQDVIILAKYATTWTRDCFADSTSFPVVVELFIEGRIPVRPVRQAHEVATHERLELAFLFSHGCCLKAVDNKLNDATSNGIDVHCILTTTNLTVHLFRCQTLPINSTQGGNTSKIMETKVKRGLTIVKQRLAFRSRFDLDSLGWVVSVAQFSNNTVDIIESEDWLVVQRDNVRPKMCSTKGTDFLVDRRRVDRRDIGTQETIALVEFETKRDVSICVERKLKLIDLR